MTVQDFEDVGVGDVLEVAFGEHGTNGFAFGAGAALERVDDGQSRFALAQVRGDRLAENVLGCGQVEDVVDDLKGEAKVAAVLAHGLVEVVRAVVVLAALA